MKLLFSALSKYIMGLLLVSVLLFLPAGTLNFLRGWLFLGLLFLPMLLLGIVLFVKAPELLEKRLRSREQESEQKQVVGSSALLFFLSFLCCGLDFRFGWSALPMAASCAAAVLLLLSYGMYAEVMRENTYLSRTVEIQEDQKLIDTGLYAFVRHPMYTATIGLFLSIPLVLGSIPAFLLMLPYPLLLVKRIRNEEALLEEGLPGYKDYQRRVPYRLFPYIW